MAQAKLEAKLNPNCEVSRRKKQNASGFGRLGLDDSVFKGISRKGYKGPTPIQRKTIPLILASKDVVGMARTGSGKSAAFLVPMLQKLKIHKGHTGVRAILISPTRELALQTFRFAKELGKFTGLQGALIVGGDSLVATPGRLLHVIVEMSLNLSDVEYVVFDEADRLFELGFEEQLREVIKRLPSSRQTLLFSATLPRTLVDFARIGLSDPVLVRLDVDTQISDKLDMSFLHCRPDEKLSVLAYLLNRVIQPDDLTIIFCATKHHVEYIKSVLSHLGHECTFLYSSLDADARRIHVSNFRNKIHKIMLVTDLAARGVDIPLLDNVINFHFPDTPKLFVHRVGRVARAGRCGKAFSIVSSEDVPYLVDLFLFLGRPLDFYKSGLVGTVPIDAISGEMDSLANTHQSSEIQSIHKVACNAWKQYIKSRKAPSKESCRRAKMDIDVGQLPRHSLFDTSATGIAEDKDDDKAADAFIRGLKNYKPNATVFELDRSNKDEACSVMKAKRKSLRRRAITSEDAEVASTSANSGGLEADNPISTALPEASETEILKTFANVSQKKKRLLHAGDDNSRVKKKPKTAKDSANYIPYQPSDYHGEKGLSVSSNSLYSSTAQDAVLDLMADEGSGIVTQRRKQKQVWDRKRKRFVNELDLNPRQKKIRTENGTFVPASLKSGTYERWKKQNRYKIESGPPGAIDASDTSHRAAHHKGSRRFGLQAKDKKASMKELKGKDQILKMRKKKHRQQSFQKMQFQRNKGKRKSNKTKKR